MRYQSFLIKYAEIGIKGKNRHIFEEALVRQIKHALKPCEGNFAVHRTYGRVFVECLSDYEYSEVTEALSRVFGISGICPIKEMPVVSIEELSQRGDRRGGPHGLPQSDRRCAQARDHAAH